MAKKYYWLKLQQNFFTDNKPLKKLRKLAGGDTYAIIYLKMLLLSIKDEGKIYFEGVESTFVSELALTLDEEEDNISVLMSFLQSNRLIEEGEVTEDGTEYSLIYAMSNIGSESESAERVRRHRDKTKSLQSNTLSLQSNINVTNCNTEIEKELDLDIELELELKKFLLTLKNIKDYPFNLIKDTTLYNTLQEKHPTLDIVKTIEDYAIYKIDHPLEEKSNPRNQINTQCKNNIKWKKNLKESVIKKTKYEVDYE